MNIDCDEYKIMEGSSFPGKLSSQLGEHDIEERLYARLDHVDEIQTSKTIALRNINSRLVKNKPRKSRPQYWGTSNNNVKHHKNDESRSYVFTEKSIPNIDVYESNSSNSVPNVDGTKSIVENEKLHGTSDKSIDHDMFISDTPKTQKTQYSAIENTSPVLDSTNNECITRYESTTVDNCNFKFLKTPENCEYEQTSQADVKLGSTKIPPILFEDLDFDHLKGTETTKRRRKFSATTIQAEMEKFYNESWGGENFDHIEIQKSMSRDESLWAIDPKDKIRTPYKRQVICNYCNVPGHRDDSCDMKPMVCYMCGETGHYEPACPNKICLNCGSRTNQYVTKCFNCSIWKHMVCQECGQMRHPESDCPDLWRRYHNTINDDTPLHENRSTKEPDQLFCSGCAQRGHLVHTCPESIPFSDLPINSPYVFDYRPVYSTDNSNIVQHTNMQVNPINRMPSTSFSYENNLQSKSPSIETHLYTKRNHSVSDNRKLKRHINLQSLLNSSFCKDLTHDNISTNESNSPGMNNGLNDPNAEKTLESILLIAANYDKNGQVIEDNSVNERSEVVASSRIYITNEAMDKLQTVKGKSWLAENEKKTYVIFEFTGNISYLSIKGGIADQKYVIQSIRGCSNYREYTYEKKETKNESDFGMSRLIKIFCVIGSVLCILYLKKSN